MSETETTSRPRFFNEKNFMEVYGDRVVAVEFIVSGHGQTVQRTFHLNKPEAVPASNAVSNDG